MHYLVQRNRGTGVGRLIAPTPVARGLSERSLMLVVELLWYSPEGLRCVLNP